MSKKLEVGQYVRVKQLNVNDQYDGIYVTQHMANLSGTIQKLLTLWRVTMFLLMMVEFR